MNKRNLIGLSLALAAITALTSCQVGDDPTNNTQPLHLDPDYIETMDHAHDADGSHIDGEDKHTHE